MHINYLEIKRFFKDHSKLLIILTLIIAILMALFLNTFGSNVFDTEINNEDDEVLESRSSYFQFYSEFEDGEQFTNVGLLRQFINLESVQENVLNETGINIALIEESLNEEYPQFEDEYTVLSISRDGNNNIFTLTVNTGDETDNMRVAQFYYDLLMNQSDQIDFLYNKNFFPFVEPTIVEEEDDENEEQLQSNNSDIFDLIKNIAIGLIVGAVISIGIALIKVLFQDKLNYSFAYDTNENDKFIIIDPELNNQEVLNALVKKDVDSKQNLVIVEDHVTIDDKHLLNSVGRVNSLSLVDNGTTHLVIIVKPYQTSRKWYQNQLEMSSFYDIPRTIVQLND